MLSPGIRFDPNLRASTDKRDWLHQSGYSRGNQGSFTSRSPTSLSATRTAFLHRFSLVFVRSHGLTCARQIARTCKSQIDERSPKYAHAALLFGEWLAPSMDVLYECIRHACLLRAISMGRLDDSSGADKAHFRDSSARTTTMRTLMPPLETFYLRM